MSATGRSLGARLLDAAGQALAQPRRLRLLRHVPSLPSRFRARYAPKLGAWPPAEPASADLRTVPGILRDPAREREAFEAEPLQDFVEVHHESVLWLYRNGWRSFVPTAPRLMRATRRALATARRTPTRPPATLSSEELTGVLKRRAAELGISAIGVARYDPHYTFEPYKNDQPGDRVIVCVLEQNYAATQTIPSHVSERAALHGYAELLMRATALSELLIDHGYRARTHDVQGEDVVLHYAVEAGLGQMGLNGQVLTPQAGSRCRITTINTDAPLVPDEPVDYGIHKICDACKVCVRRCPSGAIPGRRRMYRGVEKAKLNTARCFPVVARADGCAICMKVCPVQKFGLSAVTEEFERSGRILGKDTDELEAYDFEGTHYPAGMRPKLPLEWFEPPGLRFDPTRRKPVTPTGKDFGG